MQLSPPPSHFEKVSPTALRRCAVCRNQLQLSSRNFIWLRWWRELPVNAETQLWAVAVYHALRKSVVEGKKQDIFKRLRGEGVITRHLQHGCCGDGSEKSLTLTWEKFYAEASWYMSCWLHNKVVSSLPKPATAFPRTSKPVGEPWMPPPPL